MKKKILTIAMPVVLCLLCLFIIFRSYAWYVNSQRIGSINAETKDVSFIYKFDDSNDYNELEYNIYNLAFFDISEDKNSTDDYHSEIIYLSNMAVCVKINLENTCDYEIDYEVKFDSETYETYESDNKKSRCYVEGILSDNEMEFDSSKKFSDYINETDENKNGVYDYRESIGNLAANSGDNSDASTTIYLYLFGVQEIDSAINSDFLKQKEKFKFTLYFKSTSENDDTTATEQPVPSSESTASTNGTLLTATETTTN